MRQEFTANVSHELKTPLTSISGYSELIAGGMAKGEDVVRFAGEIQKNSSRLLTLINDILQLSELDTRNFNDDFAWVNFADTVRNCGDLLALTAEKRKVMLHLETVPEVVMIHGGAKMLEELAYNLIDNGIRYNKEDGQVVVCLAETENTVIFCVKDTGIGISKENQERIFERFYRVDKGRSFTFGVKAVNAGIPVWITILISVANVTSAGQFAGVAIMAAHGSYLEMAMTTFIINVRYMLMSFSLSQKVDKKMTLRQRLMIGYGITDEIFAVSSMETEALSARFMYGLITGPVFGWTVGTAAGALASQIMPGALSAAMELGLYAMFIAIIIPPAKKSKAVLFVIGIAVICQCIFTATPVLKEISIGFQVILSTVIAASIGAFMFPVKKEVKA